MANDLLKFLAERSHHCCPLKMLDVHGIKGQNNLTMEEAQAIADKIGVTVRTIYNWNKRVREQTIRCTGAPLCPNHLPPFESK